MKIVCLGDSFTEGYLVGKTYVDFLEEEGFETINLGRNGDTTEQILERFVPLSCDYLILLAGINDLNRSISADLAFENIKKILNKSQANENIIVIPPFLEEDEAYPRYEQINNSLNYYASLLKELPYKKIDGRKIKGSYFMDGLHMKKDFHENLAMEIIKNIKNN